MLWPMQKEEVKAANQLQADRHFRKVTGHRVIFELVEAVHAHDSARDRQPSLLLRCGRETSVPGDYRAGLRPTRRR
jgi:hypothetical protein